MFQDPWRVPYDPDVEALVAFGGILLGWGLGAGTQMLRDRRQTRVALALIHNELLGTIAQLDLAAQADAPGLGLRPARWYKRWKLARTAWDQHGAVAMLSLDADDATKVHAAYHALDAAELLFEEAREAVIALGQAVGNLADVDVASQNPEAATQFAELDARAREKLETQLTALHEAHDVLDSRLGLSH